MDIILFIGVIIIMLIGLAGTIVPLLPGLPFIFFGYLLYGWLTGWQVISVKIVIIVGVVVALSLLIDYLAIKWSIDRYEASRSGLWGAVLGALLGVVVLNWLGIIIGAGIGAFIGELIDGKPHPLAVRTGVASALAVLAGGFVKVVLAVILLGIFLWLVF